MFEKKQITIDQMTIDRLEDFVIAKGELEELLICNDKDYAFGMYGITKNCMLRLLREVFKVDDIDIADIGGFEKVDYIHRTLERKKRDALSNETTRPYI